MVAPKHVISSSLTSLGTFKESKREVIYKEKAATGEVQRKILNAVFEEPFSTVEELSEMEEFKPYHKVGGIQYAVFGLVKRGLLEQQKGESFKITKLGEDLLKS